MSNNLHAVKYHTHNIRIDVFKQRDGGVYRVGKGLCVERTYLLSQAREVRQISIHVQIIFKGHIDYMCSSFVGKIFNTFIYSTFISIMCMIFDN